MHKILLKLICTKVQVKQIPWGGHKTHLLTRVRVEQLKFLGEGMNKN